MAGPTIASRLKAPSMRPSAVTPTRTAATPPTAGRTRRPARSPRSIPKRLMAKMKTGAATTRATMAWASPTPLISSTWAPIASAGTRITSHTDCNQSVVRERPAPISRSKTNPTAILTPARTARNRSTPADGIHLAP